MTEYKQQLDDIREFVTGVKGGGKSLIFTYDGKEFHTFTYDSKRIYEIEDV